MKKMEKVKKFVEKHKVTIAYFTGAAVALASYAISDKLLPGKSYRVYNERMISVLDDAIREPRRKVHILSGCDSSNPIKLSELGKLGERVMSNNSTATGEETLTHFICFGNAK